LVGQRELMTESMEPSKRLSDRKNGVAPGLTTDGAVRPPLGCVLVANGTDFVVVLLLIPVIEQRALCLPTGSLRPR